VLYRADAGCRPAPPSSASFSFISAMIASNQVLSRADPATNGWGSPARRV
jgi:hypothetical protein